MADVITLTFKMSNDELESINISNPNKNLTDLQVKQAMATIIDLEVLKIKNAIPVAIVGAELRTIEETPYSI